MQNKRGRDQNKRSFITDDANCDTKIRKCFEIAKAVFQKLSTTFRKRKILWETKISVLKSYKLTINTEQLFH